MKRSNRVAEFPRGAVAMAVTIGVPAFVIAAIATAFVVEYSVSSDLILAFKGHVIGGVGDIAVAAVLAVAFGAVGIVCLLRLWTEIRVRREQ
jgi:branched-subunit amino acid ABC-type transport system permease component